MQYSIIGGRLVTSPRGEPDIGSIVEVEWVDATSEGGWVPIAEAMQLVPASMVTIGYTVYVDDDRIVIGRGTPTDGTQIMDPMVIPMGCIKKIINIVGADDS
jgi:hypothetical protein